MHHAARWAAVDVPVRRGGEPGSPDRRTMYFNAKSCWHGNTGETTSFGKLPESADRRSAVGAALNGSRRLRQRAIDHLTFRCRPKLSSVGSQPAVTGGVAHRSPAMLPEFFAELNTGMGGELSSVEVNMSGHEKRYAASSSRVAGSVSAMSLNVLKHSGYLPDRRHRRRRTP
jgi:hypothetical protein